MKARQQIRQEFSAGMKVPESGIYHAQHTCAAQRDLVLIAGQTFPPCPDCDSITFQIVRTAAYIHHDADFQREK
jgi:hypothetical protein